MEVQHVEDLRAEESLLASRRSSHRPSTREGNPMFFSPVFLFTLAGGGLANSGTSWGNSLGCCVAVSSSTQGNPVFFRSSHQCVSNTSYQSTHFITKKRKPCARQIWVLLMKVSCSISRWTAWRHWNLTSHYADRWGHQRSKEGNLMFCKSGYFLSSASSMWSTVLAGGGLGGIGTSNVGMLWISVIIQRRKPFQIWVQPQQEQGKLECFSSIILSREGNTMSLKSKRQYQQVGGTTQAITLTGWDIKQATSSSTDGNLVRETQHIISGWGAWRQWNILGKKEHRVVVFPWWCIGSL